MDQNMDGKSLGSLSCNTTSEHWGKPGWALLGFKYYIENVESFHVMIVELQDTIILIIDKYVNLTD